MTDERKEHTAVIGAGDKPSNLFDLIERTLLESDDDSRIGSLVRFVGPTVGDDGTPSDVRLKEDVTPLTRLDNGIGLYRYRYKWSDQLYVGVMAQEVANIVPTAVLLGKDGYLRVDYGQLGMKLMTWDEWTAQMSGRSMH